MGVKRRKTLMKRSIEPKLIAWKNSKEHLPLLLRGARQVGKSYLIEYFGKKISKILLLRTSSAIHT